MKLKPPSLILIPAVISINFFTLNNNNKKIKDFL